MQWTDPSVLLTMAGVFVTAVYTGLTVFILRATQQNTEATRNVLEAGHRPYLGVVAVGLTHDAFGGPVKVAIGIQNVGSVPSQGVETTAYIRFAWGGWRTVAGDRSRVAIYPGQVVTLSAVLTAQEAQAIFTPKALEVRAIVRYQGVTKKQYTSETTYEYADSQTGFMLTGGNFD
jgi:hypothetical protein